MKKIILVFALLFALAFTAVAQQNDSNSEDNVLLKAGTEFSATLEDTIDVGKMKRGDDFSLKLTEDVQANGETIDRGTELTGRVVRVKKIGKDNEVSEVSLYFDFLKHDGKYLLVKLSIVNAGNDSEDAGGLTFAASPTFQNATIVSQKGKNIKLEKGTVLRLNLTEDLRKPKK